MNNIVPSEDTSPCYLHGPVAATRAFKWEEYCRYRDMLTSTIVSDAYTRSFLESLIILVQCMRVMVTAVFLMLL